jgi:tetratricopeptide (TPR) repeat protein
VLVGRDLLLEAGDAALAAAFDGKGRLLLLTGEAGIGKTSLALAIADRAAERGALVRTGACWESEGLPPFTPWLDALRRPGDDECAAAAGQLAGIDGQDASDASGALRAQVRRFSEVVGALRECAARAPQVVVLEDLHWADGPSLELLVAVTAHLPTMPVLVVGTYRDDEVPMPSALSSLGGNAERLAVTGLDDASIATLLESVLARPATGAEQAAVQRQTGGNPLFVTQVARLLGSGSSAVPAGVRDVLSRRLARTTSGCAQVLGAASVLGVEFDEGVLEALVGAPVADALDEAAAARLAIPTAGSPGQWRFVHALVQATRYDTMAAEERAALHRAAIAVLQGRPGVSAATLAHHGMRGRFAPDDPAPAQLLVAAGDEALARLAWPDAETAFDRALVVAPSGGAGAPLRAEAWLGIGAARLRQGRDDARVAFDEAVAIAREVGRSDLVAQAALGFSVGLGAFEVRLLDHHQIELLEEAASSLDPADRLLPLVLARLSEALAFVESASRRQELADRAVDLARAAGDPIVLGHALAAWCDARSDPEHVAERLAAATEAVTLAQRTGDLPLELVGRRLRVVALLETGAHALAQAEVTAYERCADALADPLYTWYAPLWRATIAAADGRSADARALLNRALDQGTLGGSGNSRLLADVHELMTAVDRRDAPAIERGLTGMLNAIPEVLKAYVDLMNAYVGAALGDHDRARHSLAQLTPTALEELPRDSEWICAMVQLAATAVRTGHPELTALARAQLEPVADLCAVEGIGAYLHGPVHRFLGLLAAAMDDAEAARRHVAAARSSVAGSGAVLEARTDLDGAWALRRSGSREDVAEAVALAGRAAASLRQAGLESLAAEADELAGAPGAATDAPIVAAGEEATASLSRSGDTWAWAWQGHTVHVRHAKGVADLAVLLANGGREVHVRELEGVAGAGGSSHQEMLDPTAVEQYRQRLRDLEGDLDEADRHGDLARAAALAAERDTLVDQLTHAFGLAGRTRSVATDPDERLRKAVSARVRASIDRIEQLDPHLGRHLRSSIRTGFWCSYQPERPVRWLVERA